MSLSALLILLLLSGSGGIAVGGAIMSFLGWVFIIILLALIWEYKFYIFLVISSVIGVLVIKRIISDHNKYKDETPEEREERLKTNKMIDEWKKRNNF